jgi:hypothetical protein
MVALLLLGPQPAWPQTLAPGKPAGTEAAQRISYHTAFIAGSLAAIALAFGLPSSTPSTTTPTAASTVTTS